VSAPLALLEEMLAAHSRGDLQGALSAARGAIAADTGRQHPGAVYGLAALHDETGRLAEAEEAYTAALEMIPRHTLWAAETRLALGYCRLAQGKYDAASWGLHETRHDCPRFRPKPRLPWLTAPEWRGEDLQGKHLVILPEQGLGDEVQFARFAPWLQTLTGAEVTLVCSPPLERLFRGLGVRLRTTDEFVADSFTQRTADAWVMNMSIPARAAVTLENLPRAPYLVPPHRGTGAGVGIVTRGNSAHANDAARSLDPAAASQLRNLPGAVSLHPEDTEAWDLADTAAIIAGLDLVVTVDTSVAHLAGAMGKPVWVLLPDRWTDWRWMRDRADSPWYPSARLYRQPSPGDWGSVLEAVRRDLEA
jgi:hypothetical protein